MHPKSTSVLILRYLPFFVFTFAHMFDSFSELFCWWGIIYLLGDFTEISYTMPTQDLLQNPSVYLHCLHYLILLGYSISLSAVFLYNLSQYAPLFCIWSIFSCLSLSSSNFLLYVHTCCSWSISAFHFYGLISLFYWDDCYLLFI